MFNSKFQNHVHKKTQKKDSIPGSTSKVIIRRKPATAGYCKRSKASGGLTAQSSRDVSANGTGER